MTMAEDRGGGEAARRPRPLAQPEPRKELRGGRHCQESVWAFPVRQQDLLDSSTRSRAPAPVVRPLAPVSYRRYPDGVVADLVHERIRKPGEH